MSEQEKRDRIAKLIEAAKGNVVLLVGKGTSLPDGLPVPVRESSYLNAGDAYLLDARALGWNSERIVIDPRGVAHIANLATTQEGR